MAVHALENSRWGFASNCFVCEASNASGLRIPFFHDDEAGVVRADFSLDERFSGAPTYVHGGVALAVLDEAMAWGAIALAERFAVTETTTARFRRPLRVGATYRVTARLEGRDGDGGRLRLAAAVTDERDRVCAEATASFLPLDADEARAAIGQEVSGPDRRFVQD